jgi:hypothetical protein
MCDIVPLTHTSASLKRYLNVTPTLLHPFLARHDVPLSYHHYFSNWEKWAIAMG